LAGIVSPTVSRGARVQLLCADQTVERQCNCVAAYALPRRNAGNFFHGDCRRTPIRSAGDCGAANARRAETAKRIYTANGEMVAVVRTSV